MLRSLQLRRRTEKGYGIVGIIFIVVGVLVAFWGLYVLLTGNVLLGIILIIGGLIVAALAGALDRPGPGPGTRY